MGYLNPIEIMGTKTVASVAAGVGVDGVLVVDMLPAESTELHRRLLTLTSIRSILLRRDVACRAKDIAEACTGYLYYVSLKGSLAPRLLIMRQSGKHRVDASAD